MQSSDAPKVLLLSGYHAASHRYWCEQLTAGLKDYHWQLVALPDRHFYWRVRSNALTFAFEYPELKQHYDVLLATSMVDVCNLRGLMPHLSSIPTILYFHENQFAYPLRSQVKNNQKKNNSNLINAQLTSIYGALSADRLVFNSEYNRDSFYAGARLLLKKMPDGTSKELLSELPVRSEVIPVPVSDELSSHAAPVKNRPVEILWNHRWEYDKQPQVFFAAMKQLLVEGFEISLHVMGQSFREVPSCFAEFRQAHGDCIATWGFQPRDVYHQLLERSDIVVSTALHDFQGLGMLEAIAMGCTPVAPNRMAYPEYIADELLYQVAPDTSNDTSNDTGNAKSEAIEAEMLFQKIASVIKTPRQCESDIQRYKSSNLLPVYDRLISSVLS